jgi:hypothetical protein
MEENREPRNKSVHGWELHFERDPLQQQEMLERYVLGGGFCSLAWRIWEEEEEERRRRQRGAL